MTFRLSYMTQGDYPELCVAVYRPDFFICFHLVRRGKKERQKMTAKIFKNSQLWKDIIKLFAFF